MHIELPTTVSPVTQDDLNFLASMASNTSESGYRFVYARRLKPGDPITTYRVRFKHAIDASGRPIFEEYSSSWKSASEAARFVISLLKDRYGSQWKETVMDGRPRLWKIFPDEDEPWKWWIMVFLAGRWLPLDNRDTEDGYFHSLRHARWYLHEWAKVRFPVSGLSALGFRALPDDDRGKMIEHEIPDTPVEFHCHERRLVDLLPTGDENG